MESEAEDAPSLAFKDLAEALGLDHRGGDLPEGLVGGGDCPPAPTDAAHEIAGQADAAVPLREGLTLASLWRPNRDAEYECLLQIAKVTDADILTTMSCNRPGRKQSSTRRVCRSDLRGADMLHTQYGTVKVINASGQEEPEVITGATAFTLSRQRPELVFPHETGDAVFAAGLPSVTQVQEHPLGAIDTVAGDERRADQGK